MMNKILLASVMCFLLTLGALGQKNTLAEAIELTGPPGCGEFVGKFTITGTVLKKEYAEDELTPAGFVIREKGDKRYFVNIDYEYLSGRVSGGTMQSLSEAVSKGKRLRVKVDLCGRIYTARRLTILKQ